MDNSCPATPPVLTEANSKSPVRLAASSPDSDGIKSPSRESPDSHCVICLGKLQNKSFTDSCLHQFCFQCLLTWSKVKAECPLCKQPFKSIIHNVRSNLDYDQYHLEAGEPRCVLSDFIDSFNFDFIQVDRRFRYRSTMTRSYFRELAESFLAHNSLMNNDYYQIPPMVSSNPELPQSANSRTHGSSRHRGTKEFRRNIYNRDLWVKDLKDISGRHRECSPQFYRDNPAQVHRIVPWLNREVNVLLNDRQSQAAYILTRIISYLSQYPIRSGEFRELVQPYFGVRTEHFIHELYTFAHSVYDIAGFDQHAVYGPNPNYATEVQEISSSSDDLDSDIEVLATVKPKGGKRKSKTKKAGQKSKSQSMSNEPVPGPSGVRSGISSDPLDVYDSDQDDIKILDYVKPDPEVIVLSSGEDSPTRLPSNGELQEVCNENSGHDRLSIDYNTISEEAVMHTVRNRSRSEKGKCNWNGFGLKGKQKQKYMRSRRSKSKSRSRSKDNSSSKSTSRSRSNSTSSSSTSFSSSASSDHKSRRRSKQTKKKHKVSKFLTKSSEVTSKRHKTGSCSNIELEEVDLKKKRKRRVKSCIVVPNSKSCATSTTLIGSKQFLGESHWYPVSYWSMVSRPEGEISQKKKWEEADIRKIRTAEERPKRSKHSTDSLDLTSQASGDEG
ncbi:hypothetical protein RUM43_005092 [Polyplax serrata]|uniref:E3 ubiquitin-protein ligase Topors n=1 Tax=Polyplax serrata TaxID=468196 RepID=A0AAN8SDZ1_POLSC